MSASPSSGLNGKALSPLELAASAYLRASDAVVAHVTRCSICAVDKAHPACPDGSEIMRTRDQAYATMSAAAMAKGCR